MSAELFIKKKVVEARIHSVPRSVYRVLRSFVESSSKEIYYWNTGIIVGENVIFEKRNKWKLVINSREKSIVLENRTALILILRKENDQWKVMIEGVPEVFPVETNVLRANYVVSDVPFARGIALNEIIEKIEEFVELA